MKNNVFLISDASFKKDKTAILAVKDSHTGKTYQKMISFSMKSSLGAEELALKYAIEIAISQKYIHVIFVYDCLCLNKEKFLKRYSRNFETMQFLWLKRGFISEIDKLTKHEHSEASLRITAMTDLERDIKVIKELSAFAETADEIRVFSCFEEKEYEVKRDNRVFLLNLLYFLLSRIGKINIKKTIQTKLEHTNLNKIYLIKQRNEYTDILKTIGIKSEFISELVSYKIRHKGN